MDFFLDKVSQQAVSFAIKSGITVTSTYAINRLSRYISSTKGKEKQELLSLQERLGTKIQIISPAIDLVEIISARGNTSLESALTLTKTIRYDIQSLGLKVSDLSDQDGGRKRRKNPNEIKNIIEEIKSLLAKIEDAVPFINLAITTSGVELSSNIPHNVSPSRLLQASTLLTAGDTAYALNPFDPAQIGTTFTLSLYMLFASHSHRQEQVSAKDLTWQEVIYKCRVKLQRVPLFYDDEEEGHGTKQMRAQNKIEEYCYELCLIEDLDDGRVHEMEETNRPSGSYEDVSIAGLRTRIPIHQISKLFYTNSGTLLGIEDSNSPILLIKRDISATPSRRLTERVEKYRHHFEDSDDDEESGYALDMGEGRSFLKPENEERALPEEYDLPRHLDPEWLALEIFAEPLEVDDFEADESSQYDSQDELQTQPESPYLEPAAETDSLAKLNKKIGVTKTSPLPSQPYSSKNVKSNLSILECLLRLTILQNYQQTSHLAVHDELLNLFLSDSAWSGSGESRRVEREAARRRIGFDPFGSPTKQSQQENAKELKTGTIRLAATPSAEDAHSLNGNRREMPLRLPNTTRLEPPLPVTPNSDKRLKAQSSSKVPPSPSEPWTPEQQLTSIFQNTYISSSLVRNKSPPQDMYADI